MIDKERLDIHLNNGDIEYIMCAANWVDDKTTRAFQPYNIPSGVVFCGWRHPSIIQQYRPYYPIGSVNETQGFLTTKNRFLDRKESLFLVKNNGQLTKPLLGAILTSEDLW